jgi:phosphonatase-like hydrolase
MKIDLVVFDIAGTTVRDKGSINDAFREAMNKSGYPVTVASVNQVMGYRKIEAIQILLEKFHPGQAGNKELLKEIHDQFTHDMVAYYQSVPDLSALPHAEDIFKILRSNNIKVALDTGFTKAITDAIMERLGWHTNGLVDCIISSDEVPEGRPHPYMIQKIMSELHLTEPQQVVKVGDTEVDIAEGRSAGCGLVIAVTTGAYTRNELELYSPDHIIDGLDELPAILKMVA